MKHKYSKVLYITAALMLGVVYSGVVRAAPIDDATSGSTPTKKEFCFQKWNTDEVSKNGKLNIPKEYTDSQCDEKKGGNCNVVEEHEGGFRAFIICKDPSRSAGGDGSSDASDDGSEIQPGADPALDFDQTKCEDPRDCNITRKYINPLVNFLSAFVAIAVVMSLIIGAIQYITAAGDAQKVAAAKDRVAKTLFAFVTFIMLFAFLQWIIPGGVL